MGEKKKLERGKGRRGVLKGKNKRTSKSKVKLFESLKGRTLVGLAYQRANLADRNYAIGRLHLHAEPSAGPQGLHVINLEV